ncbi:hypothetical protein PO124_13065 [Bacillus licheniformis]|nr:hypothetical protein [Bacillus licheniformis]
MPLLESIDQQDHESVKNCFKSRRARFAQYRSSGGLRRPFTQQEAFRVGGREMGAGGSFSVSFNIHAGVGTLPYIYYGTEEQNKIPSKLASGEWIGAYALTEPGAGSDALNAKRQPS